MTRISFASRVWQGHPFGVMVVAAALALRVWGLGFGLPHTFARPDEEAAIAVALRFFGRHADPQFFDWPPVFMYLVAAAFVAYFNTGRILGWFPHESTFLAAASVYRAPLHLLARGVSAMAGTLTVWIVQRIGLRLFDRATANTAAFFLAVTALHVRDSHFGVPDVSATCLATLSFLWTLRFAESAAARDFLVSAVWAGLPASTKYNVALIAIPGVLAIVGGSRTTAVARRSRLLQCAAYAGVALVTFFAAAPFSLIRWPHFVGALESITTHLARGHLAPSGPAWQVHLSSSLWYGLGWPLLVSAIAGMVLYCWRHPGRGLLFASFPLAYFVAIGSGKSAFARYIVPVIPFLCLSAAYLIVQAAALAAATLRWPARQALLTGAIALAVAMPSLLSAVQTNRILSRTDTRVLAAESIQRLFPCGATIYQSGVPYGHAQMGTVKPATAFVPVVFDDDRGIFHEKDRTTAELPMLIVIQQSPLPYSPGPTRIRPLLSRHYREHDQIDGVDTRDVTLVYDYDDAFYVPLAGLRAVTRPGPNIRIYVRTSPPPTRC